MVDSRHDRFDLQVQGTADVFRLDGIRDHLGCVEEMTVHPGITQRLASGSKHDTHQLQYGKGGRPSQTKVSEKCYHHEFEKGRQSSLY